MCCHRRAKATIAQGGLVGAWGNHDTVGGYNDRVPAGAHGKPDKRL